MKIPVIYNQCKIPLDTAAQWSFCWQDIFMNKCGGLRPPLLVVTYYYKNIISCQLWSSSMSLSTCCSNCSFFMTQLFAAKLFAAKSYLETVSINSEKTADIFQFFQVISLYGDRIHPEIWSYDQYYLLCRVGEYDLIPI